MAATATADHADGHSALAELPPIDVGPLRRVALGLLVVGGIAFATLAALALATPTGVRDISTGYLCGFVFWASPAFGAASLMLLGYLTSASWGVVLRRCFQAMTRTTPLVALLFCPIAASLFVAGSHGEQSPFWWSDTTFHAEDINEIAIAKGIPLLAAEEIHEKVQFYLAPWPFIARSGVIFLVMGVLSLFINRWGRDAEDNNNSKAISKLRGLAGPGVILWVLTMTVLATDWVMSVEPVWASSMFPVIFGMNMFLSTFALGVLVFYSLNLGNQKVMGIVKDKFRIDMGTLILAFTMLWAYSSFCQYMLIWAGNLPEESIYYTKRGRNGWQYLAWFLMAFHWLVPFVVLLFREVKTNPKVMRWVCLTLLAVCVADVIWWICPAAPNLSYYYRVPLALSAVGLVGGVWLLAFARELAARPVLPANREGEFLAGWGEHH